VHSRTLAQASPALRVGGRHFKVMRRVADLRHMRRVVIGLAVAIVGVCTACTGEQRPRVSPAAAKRVIEQRARAWSMRGKIVDLSCRSDPDSATVTCAGSRVECRGQTRDLWSVSRGSKGKLVVTHLAPTDYCVVNVSPRN